MQKIFYHIFAFIWYVFALPSYASDDFSTTNFTVDIAKMNPLGWSTPPPGIDAFAQLIASISNVLLFMVPIIAAVSFLVAGYFYIFSAGDSEKAGKAKSIIKWNIIAIIIAFLSWWIVNIVASFFDL